MSHAGAIYGMEWGGWAALETPGRLVFPGSAHAFAATIGSTRPTWRRLPRSAGSKSRIPSTGSGVNDQRPPNVDYVHATAIGTHDSRLLLFYGCSPDSESGTYKTGKYCAAIGSDNSYAVHVRRREARETRMARSRMDDRVSLSQAGDGDRGDGTESYKDRPGKPVGAGTYLSHPAAAKVGAIVAWAELNRPDLVCPEERSRAVSEE